MGKHIDRAHFREPNLSFTKSARQHFVPRFYLARFGDAGVVEACDLETGRQFRASVRDVGVRTGFNDLEMAGRNVSTEDWLGEIEDAAAPIIGRLATQPAEVLGLSDGEENALSRFIAAQKFRVPAFREFDRRTAASMVGQIKERARGWLYNTERRDEADAIWAAWDAKPDWRWLQQDGPVEEAYVPTVMLGEVQGFANLACAMPWRTGWVDSASRLYTSDNPLSAYLPPVRPRWSGFAQHAFFFPLSPQVLLIIGSTGRKAESQTQGRPLLRAFLAMGDGCCKARGDGGGYTVSVWAGTLRFERVCGVVPEAVGCCQTPRCHPAAGLRSLCTALSQGLANVLWYGGRMARGASASGQPVWLSAAP